MSAYIKGTRRQRPPVFRDLKIGNFEISFGVIIILLFAAVYLLCLVGSKLEDGLDALTLQVASLVIFALFAYAVRKSILQLKPFSGIIDLFLGLSLLAILWTILLNLAQFFNIYNPARVVSINVSVDVFVLAIMGLINVILTVVIVIMLLYYEKDKFSEIYVRAGDVKTGIVPGVAGLVACSILALAAIYFFYTSNTSHIEVLLPVLAALGVFSLAAAFAEELWFRGMLLSRLLPLAGLKMSLLIETAIFAVFETVIAYILLPQTYFVLIVLIASAIAGYYWSRMAVQNKSILGSTLFHMGFYILLALPVIFG